MPKPKDLIPIGTWVCFNKYAYSCFDWHATATGHTKIIETSYISSPDKNYIGQIVGGTYLSEGECKQDTVERRCSTGFRDRFTATKKIFVYLVRFGYTNKPIKVLPKDVKLFDNCFNDYEGCKIVYNKNGIKKEMKFMTKKYYKRRF